MRLESKKICFVTNKHNIVPSLQFPERPTLKLESAYLELRLITGVAETQEFHKDTEFFKLSGESNFYAPKNADCAIIRPVFEKTLECYQPYAPFDESDLADEDYFKSKLMPAQDAYFIGFPGRPYEPPKNRKAILWWDTLWNLPVVRSASVASFPVHPFSNEDANISGADVLLVSGLGFKGSSGSPVIAKEWGFSATPPLSCKNYVPERLIGIMSGHWWEERNETEPDKHSGLSYLTRSTSILNLIRESKL